MSLPTLNLFNQACDGTSAAADLANTTGQTPAPIPPAVSEGLAAVQLATSNVAPDAGSSPDGGITSRNNAECLSQVKDISEVIVRKGSQFQVQSERGKNLGTEPTKKAAQKRLAQVEYFKHQEEVAEAPVTTQSFQQLTNGTALPPNNKRAKPRRPGTGDKMTPPVKEKIGAPLSMELGSSKAAGSTRAVKNTNAKPSGYHSARSDAMAASDTAHAAKSRDHHLFARNAHAYASMMSDDADDKKFHHHYAIQHDKLSKAQPTAESVQEDAIADQIQTVLKSHEKLSGGYGNVVYDDKTKTAMLVVGDWHTKDDYQNLYEALQQIKGVKWSMEAEAGTKEGQWSISQNAKAKREGPRYRNLESLICEWHDERSEKLFEDLQLKLIDGYAHFNSLTERAATPTVSDRQRKLDRHSTLASNNAFRASANIKKKDDVTSHAKARDLHQKAAAVARHTGKLDLAKHHEGIAKAHHDLSTAHDQGPGKSAYEKWSASGKKSNRASDSTKKSLMFGGLINFAKKAGSAVKSAVKSGADKAKSYIHHDDAVKHLKSRTKDDEPVKLSFTKKNGEHREMNAKFGVESGLKGKGASYDREAKGHIGAYDVDKKAYRTIPTASLKTIHIDGKEHHVKHGKEESVQESDFTARSNAAIKFTREHAADNRLHLKKGDEHHIEYSDEDHAMHKEMAKKHEDLAVEAEKLGNKTAAQTHDNGAEYHHGQSEILHAAAHRGHGGPSGRGDGFHRGEWHSESVQEMREGMSSAAAYAHRAAGGVLAAAKKKATTNPDEPNPSELTPEERERLKKKNAESLLNDVFPVLIAVRSSGFASDVFGREPQAETQSHEILEAFK